MVSVSRQQISKDHRSCCQHNQSLLRRIGALVIIGMLVYRDLIHQIGFGLVSGSEMWALVYNGRHVCLETWRGQLV